MGGQVKYRMYHVQFYHFCFKLLINHPHLYTDYASSDGYRRACTNIQSHQCLRYYVDESLGQKLHIMVYQIHCSCECIQWRSQNAKKVTHTKERLLDQAMILFNSVPSQMGFSLKGKNLLPKGGEFFSPMSSSL